MNFPTILDTLVSICSSFLFFVKEWHSSNAIFTTSFKIKEVEQGGRWPLPAPGASNFNNYLYIEKHHHENQKSSEQSQYVALISYPPIRDWRG